MKLELVSTQEFPHALAHRKEQLPHRLYRVVAREGALSWRFTLSVLGTVVEPSIRVSEGSSCCFYPVLAVPAPQVNAGVAGYTAAASWTCSGCQEAVYGEVVPDLFRLRRLQEMQSEVLLWWGSSFHPNPDRLPLLVEAVARRKDVEDLDSILLAGELLHALSSFVAAEVLPLVQRDRRSRMEASAG